MKKLLAMVLALVMTLSLAVSANAAFKDVKDINETYAESAEVLANLGVFKGYEDGSFNPKGDITRAEVAAIVYRIYTGDVKDVQAKNYETYNKFADMAGAGWARGYIGYCANAAFIKGYPDGNFKPAGKVTGYEALAMILRAVGYDKNNEFTGADWALHVAQIAQKNGILDNVKGVDLNAPATREVVAELLFRAINVPMVSFTAAFGYQNVGLSTADHKFFTANKTLGSEVFGLAKVSGEISKVSYIDKTTQFTYTEDKKDKTEEVTGVDAGFENIGYEGYVWTVPGAKKTIAAVSTVYVTGESLGNSTNGTAYDKLTKEKDDAYIADTAATVYYNGMLVKSSDVTKYTKLVSNVGVKVDFVDNDHNGKTDVVVITDYNVAEVAGIVKDNTIGTNAVEKDKYYFHDLKVTGSNGSFTKVTGVKESALVCDDELAVNDYVTYVEYNDAYYVVKAPLTTETFTRINYDKVGGDVTSYVIGGVEYIISDKDTSNAVKTLDKTNLNKKFDLYTDPYGHIIYADLSTADVDYLYVLANNHTTGISKLTDTEVVFSDGSVKTIAVKEIKDVPTGVPASDYKVGKEFNVNAIANHIYTYTENTNGSYTLTPAHDGDLDKVDYETKTAQWGKLGVNLSTKVIDLRDEDKVEIYTGYNEIPSLTDAKVCYVENDKGYITLAYLTGGTNTENLKANLIVYKTGYSSTEKIDGEYVYYLDVISDDKAVEGYKLTEKQYAAIKDLGVGEYYFNTKGNLKEFIAFPETWADAEWSDGAIKINGSYKTLGDEISYNVIDVTKGEVVEISRNTMGSIALKYAEKDVHAYAKYNEAGTAVEKLYIVIGEVAPEGSTVASYTKGGLNYLVADKKVTNPVKAAEVLNAADFLREAKLDGIVGKPNGKGDGKAEDTAFQLVATGCETKIDSTKDSTLDVTAMGTDMTIKAFYPAGSSNTIDYSSNKTAISENGVLAFVDTYEQSAKNELVFSITNKDSKTAWFHISLDLLAHTVSVDAKANSELTVETKGVNGKTENKIIVPSTLAGSANLTEAQLLAELTIGANKGVSYDATAKTLTITAPCGEKVVYAVSFVEGTSGN